jgi:drug/metabolite transporter (DMT)-like permease
MADSTRTTTAAGLGAGTAAGLLWGLAFLLPTLLTGWDAGAVTTGRYLAYGAVSLLLFGLAYRSLRPVVRRHWRPALAFAVAGNTGYYLLLVIGIELIGAPLVAIVIGSIPVVMALTGNLISRTYHWRSLLPPVALVLVGILTVNLAELAHAAPSGSGSSPGSRAAGLLVAFAAVALWTYYGLANARFLDRHPDVPAGGWSTVVGLATGAITVAALPFAAAGGWLSPSPAPAGQRSASLSAFLLASLILGILVSWAATVLWNIASARLSTTAAGTLINIETVAGYGYVYLARLQWPPLIQVTGFLIILIGVLLVVRTPRAR